jgi:hypothetical protein
MDPEKRRINLFSLVTVMPFPVLFPRESYTDKTLCVGFVGILLSLTGGFVFEDSLARE